MAFIVFNTWILLPINQWYHRKLKSASCSFVFCQEDIKEFCEEKKEEISFTYQCCASLQKERKLVLKKIVALKLVGT
jgi:hypothetical protein